MKILKERGNNFFKLLDKNLGIPLVRIFGARSPKIACKPENAKNVGVLCLGAIGDLLLASGLLAGLALSLPEADIEIVSSKSNADALPLLPDEFGKTWFSVKNPFRLLRYIQKRKYDLLIDTTQWARIGALLARFSAAGVTVGFDTPGEGRGGAYDIKVAHRPDVHETDNFAALGRALFEKFAYSPRLVLAGSPANPFALEKTIVLHFWPARGPGRILKMWPAAHWAALAEILLQRGYKILLTGSQADRPETTAFVERFFAGEKNVICIAGEYALPQLAKIMSESRALVSVNTGIMHLGAILGTPTLGLHGATNPLRWGPRGAKTASLLPPRGRSAYLNLGFEYPDGVRPAMQWISVEATLRTLEALLA